MDTSVAASKFCEFVQVGIDVPIPHDKYQVKSDSSLWFSATCASAIALKPTIIHVNKTKSITSQKLCSCNFWQVFNNVFSSCESVIPPLLYDTEE